MNDASTTSLSTDSCRLNYYVAGKSLGMRGTSMLTSVGPQMYCTKGPAMGAYGASGAAAQIIHTGRETDRARHSTHL